MRAGFVLLVLSSLVPAGAADAVVYVDQNAPGPTHDGQSWDTAFLRIRDGIQVAAAGDEVWVADGVYYENFGMRAGVLLYGGFQGASRPGGGEQDLAERDFAGNVTVIDGSQAGDPERASCIWMARNAVVDGFTITNGAGTFVEDDYRGQFGGGVFCDHLGTDSGQSTAIRNNVIIANRPYGGGPEGPLGGGICCYASSPTIADNTITGNEADAGGAIMCLQSSPLILNNVITSNAGGAVHCNDNSSPTIVNNTFRGNSASSGGAISCTTYSSPNIANNTIIGNLATHAGGAICCGCSPVITNNTIADNTAADGGAIYCFGISCQPAITNNTIVGNKGGWGPYGGDGGGIFCYQSSPLVYNNIIVGNASLDGPCGGILRAGESPPPVLTCNDVWGNTPEDYAGCERGVSDISEDPQLVDPGNGDFHLRPGSPCIEAGDNAAPGMPEVDFDGEPRIFDWDGDRVSVVDIGADEVVVYEDALAPADWFVPGWVWFSVPLVPHGSADASDLLGFDCTNRVYAWDDAAKCFQLYPDDFADLLVGRGYIARLAVGEAYRPVYEGSRPLLPFERMLPAAGWCWVGVPGAQAILGTDLWLMKGEAQRTAHEDRAAPDPWLNWNWIWWDPVARAAKIMDPFGTGDDDRLHPWWGYLVWANTEDVTIVFP